ncbi:hypothetical protein UN63_12215 [Oceanisphaera arctica]|uniref:O-antigen ligase-related domain-containing protein n=2 Tax=Oceanisphaera arctica TaxID=641510 RepID=A0A2P5TKA6_9GAMM|nr:O-antigen ligase family protein [Oceanisphaera arctica]PPL15522.1 hypothetical protein UN63_12215 [Oceanisphaera arctica]
MSVKFYFYIFTLVFFAVITTIISEKYKFGDIAFSISMPFFGAMMSLYRHQLRLPSLLFFFGVVIYCGRAMFLGLDLNTQLFNFSSRNYISVLIIFSFFSLYISTLSNRLKYVGVFISFVVVVLSDSRSGVISFSIVTLGVISLFFYNSKMVGRFFIFFLLFFVTFFIMIFSSEIYFYMYESFGVVKRLAVGSLTDSGRENVINCYSDIFDVKHLVFGLDAFNSNHCSYLANGTDNPHNSYIKMYGNLALFSFVIVFTLLWSIVSLLKRKDIVLLSILFCFLVRASTDIVFFFQSWDSYLWALIIISLPSFVFNRYGISRVNEFDVYKGG